MKKFFEFALKKGALGREGEERIDSHSQKKELRNTSPIFRKADPGGAFREQYSKQGLPTEQKKRTIYELKRSRSPGKRRYSYL